MDSFIQKSQYAKSDTVEQISKICKSPLEQLMKKYNDQKQLDKLSEAKQNVEMVAKEMNENISKMVAREASLEAIDSKAEQLSSSAFEFQNSATRLKRNMWLRSLKMKILIFLICLGVIFVLVFPFLGGGSDDSNKQDKPEEIKEGEEPGNNNNRFLTI